MRGILVFEVNGDGVALKPSLLTPYQSLIIDHYFYQRGVGRGGGVGRDLGAGVGRRGGCTSNEPISMRPLNTRTKGLPRWS